MNNDNKPYDIHKPTTKPARRRKCKTCPHRTLPQHESDEHSLAYYNDTQSPHECHTRRDDIACTGASESFKRLNLKTPKVLPTTTDKNS